MTLERQEFNIISPWWGEHLHRYYEANKIISKSKSKILDIACGNGYGAHYLSKYGHYVTGCDIDIQAINECKKNFSGPNLNYIQADGTKLNFDDDSFDYVISFETIEHTHYFNEMIHEFKRVLKPMGMILISTPNYTVNSPKGIIENKFHTQEWSYEPFKDLLKSHFKIFKIFGQEYIRYKNKKSLRFIFSQKIEALFYMKGIRKLPLSIQNKTLKLIAGLPMYPVITDFNLTENIEEIKLCKTFFAVCRL